MSQYRLEKLVIKPTLACTANCPTCQLRKQLHRDLADARKLSFEQWLTIFSDARKLGVRRLDISGGEPTLYKRLTDLIRAGKQYGWHVNVNSNGSLIDEDYARRLLAAGLDSISVSIYSADPQVHDQMRRHEGLWRKATRAVRLLDQLRADYPHFTIVTQTLLCRENYRHLGELIELHYRLGSDQVAFTYLEGDFEGKYLLKEDEIGEFRRDVVPRVRAFCETLDPAVRGEAVRVVESVYSETINSTANFAKGIYRPPELGLSPCQRPKDFTILLANGDVHPCNMVEYSHEPVMGNLFEKSLPEIWHSEKWDRFRETLFDYCRLCPINLYMAIPLRSRPGRRSEPRAGRPSCLQSPLRIAAASGDAVAAPRPIARGVAPYGPSLTGHMVGPPREDDCPNLEQSQYWPYEKLVAFQNQRLRRLLDYAYTHIPGYRRKFEQAGLTPADIRSLEDLRALPITTREELQQNEDFVNHALVRRTMYTGGSTGTSLRYYESEVAGRIRWNAHLRGWKWGRYEPGMRCCILKSAQSIVREDHIVHLVGDLAEENLAKNLEVVRSFKPEHLKGYVGSLYIFAKYCLDHNIHLHGVVSAIPSSENLYDEQRRLMEEVFGCKVFEEYCCNDGGACAWECEKREGLHYFMERAVIEDVEGRQVVTDLWNYAMPFIRYENGDSVRFLSERCSCGRELPLLKVKGRTNDILITPKGVITPTFLMHHGIGLVGVDKRSPNFRSGIRAVQYVQKPGYRLNVNIVRNPWCTDTDIQSLKRDIHEFAGGLQVSVHLVDRVATTPKGKTAFIINEDRALLAQYFDGRLGDTIASSVGSGYKVEQINSPHAKAVCCLDREVGSWDAQGVPVDRGDGDPDPASDQEVNPTPEPDRPSAVATARAGMPASRANTLGMLQDKGLWHDNMPLRLHLGCGRQYLAGYINVDYPPSEGNSSDVKADIHADITGLDFPAHSVDEIRLHHVFEHFSRVTALVLLIRWHEWLKVGGRLFLETPDSVGSAQTLTSDAPWNLKMAAIRHLAGDQCAGWGYHLDHWCAERFQRTLQTLGFEQIQTQETRWSREPYLCNVRVLAVKAKEVARRTQMAAAEQLLSESMVSPNEKRSWETWRTQLHAAFSEGLVASAPQVLSRRGSPLPLDEIHHFNPRGRDRWVQAKAETIEAGSRVLDVGAGTCPYRSFFAHCEYKTQDFKKYKGIKKTGGTEYGDIDYVSDVTSIPVPDASFDVVLCTEVLEHVPEPVRALEEMARVLRPGGRLLITAPLCSGLHELPYHYYGGMSKQWYVHFMPRCGLALCEIVPNGGFFKLLAQECTRVAWTMPQHRHLHGQDAAFIQQLFREWLPRYLFALEGDCFIDQFTAGYHVEALKTGYGPARHLTGVTQSRQPCRAG